MLVIHVHTVSPVIHVCIAMLVIHVVASDVAAAGRAGRSVVVVASDVAAAGRGGRSAVVVAVVGKMGGRLFARTARQSSQKDAPGEVMS
jgi:hypothetical protein